MLLFVTFLLFCIQFTTAYKEEDKLQYKYELKTQNPNIQHNDNAQENIEPKSQTQYIQHNDNAQENIVGDMKRNDQLMASRRRTKDQISKKRQQIKNDNSMEIDDFDVNQIERLLKDNQEAINRVDKKRMDEFARRRTLGDQKLRKNQQNLKNIVGDMKRNDELMASRRRRRTKDQISKKQQQIKNDNIKEEAEDEASAVLNNEIGDMKRNDEMIGSRRRRKDQISKKQQQIKNDNNVEDSKYEPVKIQLYAHKIESDDQGKMHDEFVPVDAPVYLKSDE